MAPLPRGVVDRQIIFGATRHPTATHPHSGFLRMRPPGGQGALFSSVFPTIPVTSVWLDLPSPPLHSVRSVGAIVTGIFMRTLAATPFVNLLFGCITGYQPLFLVSCNRSTKKDLQGIRYFSRRRPLTGWGLQDDYL